MIPSDVASSLRQILPDQQSAANAQAKPVIATQRIADVLSDLVPGQRILAEIQAVLPNGNYRAVVAQRDLTLALPSAAKAGDSVELEVVEGEGRLSLAFIANRGSGQASTGTLPESAASNLSTTGKVIGNLLNGLEGEGKRAPAAPLNGNQALVEAMPQKAADLAPVLRQAITQSGVFYEAHQARWVSGNFPTESLRQEPQSKFSPPPIPLPRFDLPPPGKLVDQLERALPGSPLGSSPTRNSLITPSSIATSPTPTLAGPASAPTAAQSAAVLNVDTTTGAYSLATVRPEARPNPGLATTPSSAPTPNAELVQPPSLSQTLSDSSAAKGAPPQSALPAAGTPGALPPETEAQASVGTASREATGLPSATPASAQGNPAPAANTPASAQNPVAPGTADAQPTPSASVQPPPRSPQSVDNPPLSRPEANANTPTSAPQTQAPGSPFPRELAPLIQQQLDGLATQNFAWQGQVWPGQQMWWEIAQNPEDNRASQGDPEAKWKTRLKLNLPSLGGIDVILNLRSGNDLGISATTSSAQSETLLRDSAEQLRKQLEAAGITLSQLTIRHGEIAE